MCLPISLFTCPKTLKTPDQMEELRAQQAQQAQQQQMMEQITQIAPAAKDLSQIELPAEAGLA